MQKWTDLLGALATRAAPGPWLDGWFNGHGAFAIFLGGSVLALAFVVVASLSAGLPSKTAPSAVGQAAIVAALGGRAAQAAELTAWMTAIELAQIAGVAGVHDPQFEADVQALYEAGTVLLTSSGASASSHFNEAMLASAA
jgi:hypothetical protein